MLAQGIENKHGFIKAMAVKYLTETTASGLYSTHNDIMITQPLCTAPNWEWNIGVVLKHACTHSFHA